MNEQRAANEVDPDSSSSQSTAKDTNVAAVATTTTTTAITTSKDEENQSCTSQAYSRCVKFYVANSFLLGIIIVILLAYVYPPLGAQYLQPQITATWLAVVFIFLMSGLGLKTEEFSKAFQQIRFNIFVQCFNFFVVSSIVYGISRFFISINALSEALCDGMVIGTSLPMTINMVIVLTKSSGGDEASAVFNAAFGNMLGVFLTPVLILGYLGVDGNVPLLDVFVKLALRVVLPVVVGQLLQKFSPMVVSFVKKYKPRFKKIQEWCLIYIVYTVFCKTFLNGSPASIGDSLAMIALLFVILSGVMLLAWFLLKLFFNKKPKLRVMGLYGCTHKTVAMGVPLINAIYETNSNVGLYTLPLLVWHPMQLVIGSALAPKLSRFVEEQESQMLGNADKESDLDDV